MSLQWPWLLLHCTRGTVTAHISLTVQGKATGLHDAIPRSTKLRVCGAGRIRRSRRAATPSSSQSWYAFHLEWRLATHADR